MITTADVVVMTKGDMVSQAEREVFRERVLEANPTAPFEANGLTGKGASELAEIIVSSREISGGNAPGHTPPLAVCTLCGGETRDRGKHHRGVLRHIDGSTFYSGE